MQDLPVHGLLLFQTNVLFLSYHTPCPFTSSMKIRYNVYISPFGAGKGKTNGSDRRKICQIIDSKKDEIMAFGRHLLPR